ncbi:restriction endonuclease subunit S [Psychrobacter sp. T6-6]|uniref:restriction endonuclease subunit S n=1 Tax=Psychrobacter sp. T6-6 TaxID=3457452 RepID=UPI003FD66CFC
MSELSYMDKLLDGVEVEWMALEKAIKSLKTGLNPRKNFQLNTSDAKNFYITVREIQNGKVVFLDKTDRVNDSALELINNRSNLEVGDILFSGTGTVGRTSVIEVNPENWNIKEGIYVIKPNKEVINSRYLFYLLNTQYIVKKYSKKIVGSPVVSLPMSELKRIQIPIPTLNIQTKIVQILDAFTELTAELTAELVARKQQYAYYRKQLLTFNDGEVEWKTLKEVALELGRGKSRHRPRNDPKLYGGDVPLIQTGDVRNASHVINEYTQTYSKFGLEQSKLWPKGTLCITIAANIAETTILGFDSCFPDSIIGFVADPEKTTTSYVEYLLTSFKSELQAQSTGSAQSNINLATFERLKFPFPPLTEQQRIVTILDKFDALTTSLTEGLPREIELRQQQYEYYRELLLSFPKTEVAEHD